MRLSAGMLSSDRARLSVVKTKGVTVNERMPSVSPVTRTREPPIWAVSPTPLRPSSSR